MRFQIIKNYPNDTNKQKKEPQQAIEYDTVVYRDDTNSNEKR